MARRTPRLRALAVGLACGLLAFTAGCGSKPQPPQRVGGSTASKAETARKDAEALAVAAVTGGADAQAKAVPEVARRDGGLTGQFVVARDSLKVSVGVTERAAPAPAFIPTPPPPAAPVSVITPTPPVPPMPRMATPARPTSPAVIREHVTSGVSTTEAEADADALAQVRDTIERKLGELDPPVRYRPSATEAQAEFVRKGSRAVGEPDPERQKAFAKEGFVGKLVLVSYDVEITAEQVRELRAQERAGAGLRMLGMLVAVALAGFLFLRADEWTKGYLTSWLAIAAVVLAGGAAALLICV